MKRIVAILLALTLTLNIVWAEETFEAEEYAAEEEFFAVEAEEEPFALEIEEFTEAFEETLPVVPEEAAAIEPGLVRLLKDAVLYSDAACSEEYASVLEEGGAYLRETVGDVFAITVNADGKLVEAYVLPGDVEVMTEAETAETQLAPSAKAIAYEGVMLEPVNLALTEACVEEILALPAEEALEEFTAEPEPPVEEAAEEQAPDPNAPAKVTEIVGVPVYTNAARISWKAVSGAGGYQLFRADSANGEFKWIKNNPTTTVVNYVLTPGADYWYKVRAYTEDAEGKRTYGPYSDVVKVHNLGAIENFTVQPKDTNCAFLKWDKVDGCTGYQVFRTIAGSGEYQWVKNATTAQVANYSLTPGTTYYYKLRAYIDLPDGSRAYGQYSDGIKVEIMAIASITSLKYTGSAMQLTWEKQQNVTGYQVFFTVAGTGGEYTWAANTSKETYSHTKATAGKDMYYKIRSYRDLPDGSRAYGQYSEARHCVAKTDTAWELEKTDFVFRRLSDGTLAVAGYTGSEDEIAIPSEYDGKTVVSIADKAFEGSSVRIVTLPETITTIGTRAFAAGSLVSINLPDSLTDIADDAFDGPDKVTVSVNPGTHAYEWAKENGYVDDDPEESPLEWFTFLNSGNGTCILTKYTGDKENSIDICIPRKNAEGLRVVSIDDFAFKDCSNLTSVTIPDSVTSIGKYAFYNCSSLTSITIPNSVTSFREYAFYNCSSLTSITIPNSITSIRDYFFYGCSSLTSITIPESVTIIGDWAFENCSSLTSITIPDNVISIGRFAFENCSSLTNIAIPCSVTSIGGDAFYGCSSLTSITIPNSVTSISGGAFYYCTSLTSITIPDSVISIGGDAFYGCSSLTSITIPNSVISIGSYAFCNCTGLTSIQIPDSVISIGGGAFSSCSSLTSITILGSITSIGYSAFRDCSKLTSITIPYGATSIGDGAFYNCSSLTSITIPGSVTSIGTEAFYYCSGLTSITIPDGGTSIGDSAFEFCRSLSSITIPESVTSIGKEAFEYCYSLTSITIPDGITSIGENTFNSCVSLTSITIPESVISIAYNAFSYCNNLSSVFCIPNSFAWSWCTDNYYYTDKLIAWDGYGTLTELVQIDDPILDEQPRVVSIVMPDVSSVQTGETVQFKVTTVNATSVTLVVDGIGYDTVRVNQNYAMISRAFTLGGLRQIAIQANAAGKKSTVTQAGTLLVNSEGILDAPSVCLYGSYNTGAHLTAIWEPVNHAASYVIYLYHEGTQLLRDAIPADRHSYEIDSALLSNAGNYSIAVYAIAPGFSQHGGTCDFSLTPFTPYTACLQQSSAVVFRDAMMTSPIADITSDDELLVLYRDDQLALIRITASGQEGFIAANRIGEAALPVESHLKCWYSRRNRIDPQCAVTITIHATTDMDNVVVDVNGTIYPSADGQAIQGDDSLRKYLIDIPAVTSQSTYRIIGYHGNEVVMTTSITVAPVQAVALAAPQLGQFASLKAQQDTTLTWIGSTGAEHYEVTLTKDDSVRFGPETVDVPSVKIPGTAINVPGNYTLTVTAKNATTRSEAASTSLTVVSSKQYYYLQADTWRLLYSYDYLSMHDLLEIVSETGTTYDLRATSRTGETRTLVEVPKAEVVLGKQKYVPLNAPYMFGGIKASNLVEGSTCHIEVETNHVTESAVLLVDGVLAASLTVKRESFNCVQWECGWTVTSGSHTLKIVLTGANGIQTAQEKTFTATHQHTPDFAKAVFDTSRITEQGVLVQSAACTGCGQTFSNIYASPDKAFPQIAVNGTASIRIKKSLAQDNLTISINNGKVLVEAGAVLDVPSITCKELHIRGTVHVHSIQVDTLIVEGNGQLIMADGSTLRTRDFDFGSSNNHSSLLTGGEMTITGNMTINSPFTPGSDHATIFTGGKHLLNNRATTRFGILVTQCSAGDLGSLHSFAYQYVIVPKSSLTDYHVPEPVVPASLAPYVTSGYRLNASQAMIEEDLRQKEYAKHSGVKFNLNLDKVYEGTYFYVTKMTSNDSMEGSLEMPLLQQIAFNALSDCAGSNTDSVIGSMLYSGEVDYQDVGFYDLNTVNGSRRVQYRAHVTGIAAGNGVSTGLLTISYSEWLNGTSTQFTNTYQLIPTEEYTKQSIKMIMRNLSWQGKKHADQQAENMALAVATDIASFTADVAEWEAGRQVVTAISALCDTATYDPQEKPLLRVYTSGGSMAVYSSQVTGGLIYSDVATAAFDGLKGK